MSSQGVETNRPVEPSVPVSENFGTVMAPEKTLDGHEAYEIFDGQVRFLKGRVLTVIDASLSDPEQRKAVKDLVRQEFALQLQYMHSTLLQTDLACAGDGHHWIRTVRAPGFFDGGVQKE